MFWIEASRLLSVLDTKAIYTHSLAFFSSLHRRSRKRLEAELQGGLKMPGNAGLGRWDRQFYKRCETYLDPSSVRQKPPTSGDRWQTLLPLGYRGRTGSLRKLYPRDAGTQSLPKTEAKSTEESHPCLCPGQSAKTH